jgi:hypothetical protein
MKYAMKTLRRKVYYSIHIQWIINTFPHVFVPCGKKVIFRSGLNIYFTINWDY